MIQARFDGDLETRAICRGGEEILARLSQAMAQAVFSLDSTGYIADSGDQVTVYERMASALGPRESASGSSSS